MAELADGNPTFIDLTKDMATDGSVLRVAEVLNQTAEGMDEMSWQEGNHIDGHEHGVRTGLPDVTWAQLYKGVQPSKGTQVAVMDKTGIMESLSEVDVRLLRMARDPMGFRFRMDRPHIQSMMHEFWRVMFKGTYADADKFVGLEARYNDLSAANADNIVVPANAGGEDTDIHSIWLICWSPTTLFGIVPKGSQAGIKQEDWGIDRKADAAGGLYQVARTHWEWAVGLAVEDWRYAVRGVNIDASELVDDAATGVNLPSLMSDMIERLPSDAFAIGRVAFYMNRTLIAKLRRQLMNKVTASTLTFEMVGPAGPLSPRRKMMFDGIPVNRVDALAVDETVVA